MNRYEVIILPQAESNLQQYAEYIAKDSRSNAKRWLEKMREKIMSLDQFPEACPLAFENSSHERELRQLVSGRYRVIFYVDAKKVNVVSVRHGAQLPAKARSLDSVH